MCVGFTRRTAGARVLSVISAVGSNRMQRQRSGSTQRPQPLYKGGGGAGGGGRVGSVCASKYGVCVGKGRGQGVCKL